MPPDLQSSALARRGREYWHLDGLPTLVAATLYLAAVGLFLLLVHLLRHINDHSHKWSLLADLLNVFAGFAVITSTFWVLGGLIWLGINWEDLIEWFKLRITYPRTGYVAPPRYWQPDSSVASGDPVTTCQQSRLCRWLTILGSFWFWVPVAATLTPFWDFQLPSNWRVVLLGFLLAVRGLRFGLYPTFTPAGTTIGAPLRVTRFLSSVFNSVLVWALVIGILPKPSLAVLPWLRLGIDLLLIGISVRVIIPEVGGAGKVIRIALLGGCASASFASFLVYRSSLAAAGIGLLIFAIYWGYRVRNPAPSLKLMGIYVCGALSLFLISRSNIGLGLLVPGFYAGLYGGCKLLFFLRANPSPQP